MRKRYDIADGSLFDRSDKRFFQPHTQLPSMSARKIKRLPGLSNATIRAKRALGCQFQKGVFAISLRFIVAH
jgi:hypothetical protein